MGNIAKKKRQIGRKCCVCDNIVQTPTLPFLNKDYVGDYYKGDAYSKL